MRLVIDGQRLTAERTGVGRCLESLLAEWGQSGLPLGETVVMLRDARGLERVPRVPGLTAKVVAEAWPGLAWECFGLGRELRRGDLLFAPANLVPPTWSGRTVLVVYDTLPWTVPDSFPRLVQWRFRWRYRLAAQRAERVLVPSRATAVDVARVHGIPAEKIRVVYPGPEPAFGPLEPGSPLVVEARRQVGLGDEPFFLFVGKRSQRRNVPALLEAFARHRGEHSSHRLVFAGPDADPLPGPEAGTLRAGHVSEQVLRGLLAGAVALFYPSDYEGFGLPVVEALASGCPVVTLRNSALTEAGGDAPWYLDSAEPAAMLQAMNRLAGDATERRRRIARGFAHVAQFSRARFAAEVKAELREAAASQAHRTPARRRRPGTVDAPIRTPQR